MGASPQSSTSILTAAVVLLCMPSARAAERDISRM